MVNPTSSTQKPTNSKASVITAASKFGGGDTKVLTDTLQQEDLATPWHVVVYNDPVNLINYVTMVLRRIFGYSESKARSMTMDVHQKGECVVWTGEREKAELYVRQLQGYQLMAALRKAAD